MIKSKHKLAHCKLCECDMVRCATCGNNCCNALNGMIDGKMCPDCDEAYEHQDVFWKKGKIQFSKDERKSLVTLTEPQ